MSTITEEVDPLIGQPIEDVRKVFSVDEGGREVVIVSLFVGMGWDWYDRARVVRDSDGGNGESGEDGAVDRLAHPTDPVPGSLIENVGRWTEQSPSTGRWHSVVSLRVKGKCYDLLTEVPEPTTISLYPQPDPGLTVFKELPNVERGFRCKLIYEIDEFDGRTIWQVDLRKDRKNWRTGEWPWREVGRKKYGVLPGLTDSDDEVSNRPRRPRSPEPEETEEEHMATNAWFCRRDWCPIHQDYYHQ